VDIKPPTAPQHATGFAVLDSSSTQSQPQVALLSTSRTDRVVVESLADDLYGELNGRGSCVLPATLTPARPFYVCSFTETVTGEPGDLVTDTINAQGRDPRGNLLEASDSAISRCEPSTKLLRRITLAPPSIAVK